MNQNYIFLKYVDQNRVEKIEEPKSNGLKVSHTCNKIFYILSTCRIWMDKYVFNWMRHGRKNNWLKFKVSHNTSDACPNPSLPLYKTFSTLYILYHYPLPILGSNFQTPTLSPLNFLVSCPKHILHHANFHTTSFMFWVF